MDEEKNSSEEDKIYIHECQKVHTALDSYREVPIALPESRDTFSPSPEAIHGIGILL